MTKIIKNNAKNLKNRLIFQCATQREVFTIFRLFENDELGISYNTNIPSI